MNPSDPSPLKTRLRESAAAFGMHPPEEFPRPDQPPARGSLTLRRRRGEFAAGDNCCLFELRRDANGVLRWQDGFAGRATAALDEPPGAGTRRALRRSFESEDELVEQLQFERLQPNQIVTWLDQLDHQLAPQPHGLLRLDAAGEQWLPPGKLPTTGKLLLLIHGTFSSAGNFLAELRATPHGRKFLKSAQSNYAAVFAFQHSTLSVSPWLNALDLASALETTKAQVDIIAHGRGGLVARWWADCLDHKTRERRCMLVGSPLAGTSGASPAAIRQTMDLFTNVAEALENTAALASTMVPMLSVVAGMLKIVGSVTGAVANLPIADAVISAIPGLGAQSATSNNYEMQALRRSAGLRGTIHFAVRSDFQPVAESWRFWRYFTDLSHATNFAADRFIFRQANDLVVDYAHMTSLADAGASATLPKARVLDLGKNPDVWHGNYFRNPAVIIWLQKQLDKPS